MNGAPSNPLIRQRADAQIFRHSDGAYYMTGSVPEYDRLIIRRSSTLAGLGRAAETIVWRRPAQGRLGGYIWAPELHHFGGRWHMYFAAGDKDEPFHIRTYVLDGPPDDALAGQWHLRGQLETPWDTFTLDSTSFVHRGVRYLCWAQKEPGIDTNSNLYLAPLATPTTLARPPVRLSVPTLGWEVRGFKVNEAPAVLARNGRLFLTYSASATDARYCLGLLTADAASDIMAPASWTKSQDPVFVSSDATGVYGSGHNSFTVDEEGRDILVYHGRDYATIEGDPLFDPNRHTRIQRLYYRADGTPDFGVPVGNGPLPDRLSPISRAGDYLSYQGDRVTIATEPLASTQFRRQPGLAGARTVSLEPIEARGRYLCGSADGKVRIAAPDGSAGFAERSSFVLRPGLADPGGISFALAGQRDRYLSAASSSVEARPVGSGADRAAATFRLS